MKIKTLVVIALLGCKTVFLAQTSPPPSCIPPNGLVAYWPMDNANQADALGGAYPALTVSGAILNGTDRFSISNSAYRFDGLNDYIETGFAGILGSNPRAVSFWAKVPATYVNVTSGNGMYPVAWGANSSGQRFGCSLDFPANQTAIGGANLYQSFVSTGNINDDAWHHYVFQYSNTAPGDFTTVEVYVDGVCFALATDASSGANTALNTVNAGSHNVHFGKTNFSTPSYFEGLLDEVAIWNRVLTPCEIHRLFNCTDCDDCCLSHRAAAPAVQVPSQGTLQLSNKNRIVLNQNVPNPFAESTEITYNIPESFTKAQLQFSDVNGTLIQTVDITNAGKGSLTVFADDLRHGIYSYRLVVDGKTIDTKKMIKE
jgi:hypothetical protein